MNTSTDLFGNKTTADNPWAGLSDDTTTSATTNPWAALGDGTTTLPTTNLWGQEGLSDDPYHLYSQKSNLWTNANAYSGLTQGLSNKTSSISPPQNKTYTLQAHSRALEDTAKTGLGRFIANAVYPYHTGYDLVETDVNGNQNMQTLALNTVGKKVPSGGVTEIQSRQGPAQTYTLNDGRKVAWYDQLKESQQQYKNTPNYLEDKNVQTAPLLDGKAAQDAFYKISVYGDFMNPFKLDYDLEGPNCNTWTTMMHNKYINPKAPQTVSSLFNRNHIGDGGDYKTSNTPQENQNAQFVELLTDTYLDHTPMEGHSRPRNIRSLNGTSTTGPIATFSNGQNHFVVNSHGNKGFSNQDYADVFQNALLNNRTGMGLGANLLTEIGLKGYQKMNQLPNYDVFIDNKKIK